MVHPDSLVLSARAFVWWHALDRLGCRVPFFVVHDLGLLCAVEREHVEIGPRRELGLALSRVPSLRQGAEEYRALIEELARGELAQCASTMKLGDDVLVAALARILACVDAPARPRDPSPASVLPDAIELGEAEAELPRLFAASARSFEQDYLEALARAQLRLVTVVDALDVGTLRLLGTIGSDGVRGGALAHVDLLAALSNPNINDIVSFSLELLPAVLETRNTQATGTHAVHGYAGVGRRGTIDSMVLSELAWDEDELARRILDAELFYFTREQAREQAARVHHVLIDASASMRGDREVFARGLAIALGKKLQLAGEEVWMRFFDSRLYDVHRSSGRKGLPVTHLLGFKGERGRNPARVFRQLATEIALLRARDSRVPIVHVITHAALYVPKPLVQEVRRQARIFAVFILPSGGNLDLDWLDLLESYTVVDHATLREKGPRAEAAARIVDETARVTAHL